MKYKDEGIIKALNAYKRQVQGNIYDGFTVCEDLYRFREKEVIPSVLKMYLPIRFKDVTEGNIFNMVNMDKVYANKKQTIQLKFKQIEERATEEEAAVFLKLICEQMVQLNPAIEILEKGMLENSVHWMDYKTVFGKANWYSLTFSMWKAGKVLYGEFSCSYHEAVHWKTIFLSMLSTAELFEN